MLLVTWRRFCHTTVRGVLLEVVEEILKDKEYDPDNSVNVELVKTIADEVHTKLKNSWVPYTGVSVLSPQSKSRSSFWIPPCFSFLPSPFPTYLSSPLLIPVFYTLFSSISFHFPPLPFSPRSILPWGSRFFLGPPSLVRLWQHCISSPSGSGQSTAAKRFCHVIETIGNRPTCILFIHKQSIRTWT